MLRIKFLVLLLLFNVITIASYADGEIYDTLIVGGGASGTYCAWRLSEHDANKSICLMELSERIGGRLYSLELQELPGVYAEFGGMRFSNRNEHVKDLVAYLQLPTESFEMGSAHNLLYLRRNHYTFSNFAKKQTSYNLRKDERGKTDVELLMMVIHNAFPEMKSMDDLNAIQKFLREATYKGRPIWKWGFWNFLINELSIEGYQFIDDAYGYLSEMSNWNAYDAIIDILEDVKTLHYTKLKNGFATLPQTMANLFVQNGGKLNLNTRVTSLHKVRKEGNDLIKVIYNQSDKISHCYAKHLILAMPKRSIELLDEHSFIFSTIQFINDLQRVTPQAASKIFMWFDQEWWTKLGLFSGPSRTDLPMNQCYYFFTETKTANDKSVPSQKGLLMASYNDGSSVEFWDGFFEKSAFDLLKARISSAEDYLKIYEAPGLMIQELTIELKQMHSIDIPKPKTTLFVNWNDDPFGGGWHFWNPNNQSWIVAPHMRHPISDANIYICGEAYAIRQSWVESAINSAELLLQEHFSLPRASWIKPNYDLGP